MNEEPIQTGIRDANTAASGCVQVVPPVFFLGGAIVFTSLAIRGEHTGPSIAYAVLFAIFGILLTIVAMKHFSAVRATQSVLILDTIPAVMGTTMRGRIEVSTSTRRFLRATPVSMRLAHYVASTDGGMDHVTTLWQSTRVLPASCVTLTDHGATIQIEAPVPNDREESNAKDWRGRHMWSLAVKAAAWKYAASFEVPVRR